MSVTEKHGASPGLTRWVEFWSGSVDPHIYAALRMLLGSVGLVTIAGLGDFSTYWSCDGLVMSSDGPLCEAARAAGLSWLPGALLLAATVLSFIAVVIGYQTTYAVSAAFICLAMIVYWNPLPLSAAQQVLRTLLFCLIWANSGRVFSVDARHARRKHDGVNDPVPSLPVWPLRLFQIQVALVYLVTGLWKLANVTWRDGSAIHYVLENNQFSRFSVETLPIDGLLTLATYLTLFWELGFAFMLLNRRTRRWALAIGVVMHIGMWATLELGSFSAAMLASYVAFVDPARVRRWLVPGESTEGTALSGSTAPAGNLEAPR